MNLWTFTGRLGRDSELIEVANGDMLKLAIAVSTGYGQNKQVLWVDCALFGKRAESLQPYLKKGTQVVCAGEVSLREYRGKDGSKATALSVRVSEIELVGERRQTVSSDEGDDDVPY